MRRWGGGGGETRVEMGRRLGEAAGVDVRVGVGGNQSF